MREEMGLYKAKRKDNGKWIQGYLFCIWEKAYILLGTMNGIPNMEEVDPETVCQYIRESDKEGYKIHIGDRVKSYEGKGVIAVDGMSIIVRFDNGAIWEFIKGFTGKLLLVIGNIHDKAVEE